MNKDSYNEWYHVWWSWLTSKRVARFVSDSWVSCYYYYYISLSMSNQVSKRRSCCSSWRRSDRVSRSPGWGRHFSTSTAKACSWTRLLSRTARSRRLIRFFHRQNSAAPATHTAPTTPSDNGPSTCAENDTEWLILWRPTREDQVVSAPELTTYPRWFLRVPALIPRNLLAMSPGIFF